MTEKIRAVIDASAVIMYFERQRDYIKVASLFKEASDRESTILISTVNLGEVYYIYHRRVGEAKAEEILTHVFSLPIRNEETNIQTMKQAAIFKSTTNLSYADCYAAALAKLKGKDLITADKDFIQLKNQIKMIVIG